MIETKNDTETEIKIKFTAKTFTSRIIELLKLTSPNKIIPVEKEFDSMCDKINNCKTAFEDSDECSTVGLSSNPSSFSSNESAEEYFSSRDYSFVPTRFKMKRVLGSGSFGTVFLADYDHDTESTGSVKSYAVKRLLKANIKSREMEQILEEKRLLEQMNDPFVLRLFGTCQNSNELYFITEVVDCGDLFSAIYCGDRLSHKDRIFYSAEIILGLNYIHNKNIVFRDLKPENIMIDSRGVPKIIDFGLAKQLPYIKASEDGTMRKYTKCSTLCGTPEYVSPEIILSKPYNHCVDLWALGILIYEMIFRRTPFLDNLNDNDISKIFVNVILAGKNGVILPNKIDKRSGDKPYARELIIKLFSGNENDRFLQGTVTESLLLHPYFTSESISKEGLYNGEIEAPIIQPQFIGSDISTAKPIQEYTGDQEMFSDF